MEKIKKFLAGRGVGYYLTLPAIAFCIAAFCLYRANGVTSFSPELNQNAIAYVIVCLSIWFILSQVSYIGNVFVAIDGYTFTGGFIATAVMYVLSFLFTLLSAILSKWRPWAKKAKEVQA